MLESIRGTLICSCQPLEGSPTDRTDMIVAMAQAAVIGGSGGLRIEGIKNLVAVRKALPDSVIIGIVKRDLSDSPVRITAFVDDVLALAESGADIIAVDGTDRPRPFSREVILDKIRSLGKIAMADCSNAIDGRECHEMGFDIIGTTLSGYTENTVDTGLPDFELLKTFVKAGYFAMAEGRYNSPELAARAINLGASAVTVGSAITRIENICRLFLKAMKTQR